MSRLHGTKDFWIGALRAEGPTFGASIAEALLQTLPPESARWDDDELASELDRRLDEALSDPSSTVSWTDLKARR